LTAIAPWLAVTAPGLIGAGISLGTEKGRKIQSDALTRAWSAVTPGKNKPGESIRNPAKSFGDSARDWFMRYQASAPLLNP